MSSLMATFCTYDSPLRSETRVLDLTKTDSRPGRGHWKAGITKPMTSWRLLGLPYPCEYAIFPGVEKEPFSPLGSAPFLSACGLTTGNPMERR